MMLTSKLAGLSTPQYLGLRYIFMTYVGKRGGGKKKKSWACRVSHVCEDRETERNVLKTCPSFLVFLLPAVHFQLDLGDLPEAGLRLGFLGCV